MFLLPLVSAEYQLLCGNQAPGFIIDIHTGKPIGKVAQGQRSTLGGVTAFGVINNLNCISFKICFAKACRIDVCRSIHGFSINAVSCCLEM